jgi:hypothetical protein
MSDVSSASLPPPAPDAGIASASTLASAAAVRATLASLAAHSASLDAHLAQLLGAAAPRVAAARARIAHTQPQVALILEEAGVLQSRLADTSANAARISEAVRRLDEEQSRIDVAARWAERTADLRVSGGAAAARQRGLTRSGCAQAALHSLASAIEQADWDAATRHCIRAMSIDADILGSDFAAAVVVRMQAPAGPGQRLTPPCSRRPSFPSRLLKRSSRCASPYSRSSHGASGLPQRRKTALKRQDTSRCSLSSAGATKGCRSTPNSHAQWCENEDESSWMLSWAGQAPRRIIMPRS